MTDDTIPMDKLARVYRKIKAELDAEKTSILLLINRQGRDRFTAVTVK